MRLLSSILVGLFVGAAAGFADPVQLPGPRPDGSTLLPNQWSLHPAGQQIELGDFPVNIAVHPQGRYAAVLHSGYSQHAIRIVDLTAGRVVTNVPVKETFYGIEFSRDGAQLFCSGGADEVIHQYRFADGNLSDHHEIRLREAEDAGVPAGLVVGARELWVANLVGQSVSRVNLNTNLVTDLSVASSVTDTNNQADDTHPATVESTVNRTGAFPYACRLDEKRQRLYVSLWGEAAVAVIDVKTQKVIARWPTQEQPNEMLLTRSGKILFVANANRNTVTVLDTTNGKTLETLAGALYPGAPAGSTPNSLALTPDEKTLFVANADNNNLAVFDVSKPGKSRSLGFIPVGWYPTSVRVTPDGKKLLVANGKGGRSLSNPDGPAPGKKTKAQTINEYIAQLLRGSLSGIDLPSKQQLADYTATAYQCSPLKRDAIPAPLPADIKYVFYIIKENRTYDQIFGDLPQGNGDKNLCLFPEVVTPNHHQLARDFVLLDNFYADAEVSADGHEWTMGAYASSFAEKIWPLQYGHNRSKKYPYPSEGIFPMATPAGGYLWDRAAEAGVSYRSYGEFVANSRKEGGPTTARLKSLRGHIDEQYRGFDLNYPDVKRADRLISELKRYETVGEMPRLQVIRLPGDHTVGATLGKCTPNAFVADNDLALGRIVEAISHSKFWPQTAIFVVEDDAQNGADHVDCHRTIAFAISPYIRRRTVDSTMYSTSSMLRTIELLLGLKPMSQFDSAATPMTKSFQAEPDLAPYTALPAKIDLDEKNVKTTWGERESRKMDFSREDAADDLLLNAVIWRAVRGDDAPVPAPTRAGFVYVHNDKDGDD
jgi:DNA-binding beta-propeller fold protein YncE